MLVFPYLITLINDVIKSGPKRGVLYLQVQVSDTTYSGPLLEMKEVELRFSTVIQSNISAKHLFVNQVNKMWIRFPNKPLNSTVRNLFRKGCATFGFRKIEEITFLVCRGVGSNLGCVHQLPVRKNAMISPLSCKVTTVETDRMEP
jgi:hypothetical protein